MIINLQLYPNHSNSSYCITYKSKKQVLVLIMMMLLNRKINDSANDDDANDNANDDGVDDNTNDVTNDDTNDDDTNDYLCCSFWTIIRECNKFFL